MFKVHHEMQDLIAIGRKEIHFLTRFYPSFLFMVTVNGCFPLFFYHYQTHKTTKTQSTRLQKQALQILLCLLLSMFLKIFVLKQTIKK